MKKTLISLMVVTILAAGFTACKKDYTCHCKKTSNTGEDHFTVTAKKKDANGACEAIKTANPSLYSSCEIE